MSQQFTISELEHESIAFRQARYSCPQGITFQFGGQQCIVRNFSAFGLAVSAVAIEELSNPIVTGEVLAHGKSIFAGEFRFVRSEDVGLNDASKAGGSVWAFEVCSGVLPLEKMLGVRLAKLTAKMANESIETFPEPFRLLALEFIDFLDSVFRQLESELEKMRHEETNAGINQHIFLNSVAESLLSELTPLLDARLGLVAREVSDLKSVCLRHLGRKIVDRFGVDFLRSGSGAASSFPVASVYLVDFAAKEKRDLAELVFGMVLDSYFSCPSFTSSVQERNAEVFKLFEKWVEKRSQRFGMLNVLLVCPLMSLETFGSLGETLDSCGAEVSVDIYESDRAQLLVTQRNFHQWQLNRKGKVKARYFAGKSSDIGGFGLYPAYDLVVVPYFLDSLSDSECYEFLSLLFHHLGPKGALVAGQYLPSEKTQNIFEVSGRERPRFRSVAELEQLVLPICGRSRIEEAAGKGHFFISLMRTALD